MSEPRRTWWKRVARGAAVLALAAAAVAGIYVGWQVHAFDQSMAKEYDVPLLAVEASQEPSVVARGKHLVDSMGACSSADCHGARLEGGSPLDLGPLGTMSAPNITPGGKLARYTDPELHRLLRHGVRRDGRSVQFMPVHETNWLPDHELVAIISYLRTVPPSDRVAPPSDFSILAKVLDRRGQLHVDIARRIDHHAGAPAVPAPAPTSAYGAYVARNCTGCHGEHLSGGRIPGTPPSIPVPGNITPDDSGIGHYSYDTFVALLETGKKPDGSSLDPFMPYAAFSNLNDVEKKALWSYLRSVPPRPFGGR